MKADLKRQPPFLKNSQQIEMNAGGKHHVLTIADAGN